ncbi:putative nuclease HARBI1 [Photinus pyralis]|uniref:putative nuclease HARBI1 n=1 Tax=Photinus pyralis TaxID=7054 RepID=UPI001267804E|nr:putative nuclease HARBI1 [Photinus pyralis]
MFATRIHESTISLIIREVCQAIIKGFMNQYLKMPQTVSEWECIAKDFEEQWNFPMCIGAIDGKHINFQAPQSAGSFYYNYKGHHSIVLLALVDAKYKFIYVDVGVNGRNSDGCVFRESSLKHYIDNNLLNFPDDKTLPGTTLKVPFCMVGDDAFPMSCRLMKPYPSRNLTREKRIFNYRLSRARRIVENAFGILANRFRILLNTINLSPEKAEMITLTCCILHNHLASNNPFYTRTEEECHLESIASQGGSHSSREAINIRDKFCEYFNSVGRVEWQDRAVGIV